MDLLLKEIEKTIEKYNLDENELLFDGDEGLAKDLTELINSFPLNSADWERFVHFDKQRYTRNLIAFGKEKRFGLMILAWGAGHKSPIHDHNGSHCIMRVLEGNLVETLYSDNSAASGYESDTSLSGTDDHQSKDGKINGIIPRIINSKQRIRETLIVENQTAYIHDKIGWHRITNPSKSSSSISLHLYAPPIEECKTYCEVEGKVRAQASCPFYSINGILE